MPSFIILALYCSKTRNSINKLSLIYRTGSFDKTFVIFTVFVAV